MKRPTRCILSALVSISVPLVFAGGAAAKVIVVSTTIQAAVDSAVTGDTVRVPPGIYHENVLVIKSGLTIDGGGAVMDGSGLSGETGILVAAALPAGQIEGFHLIGLSIRNYRGNGVLLDGVNHFSIRYGKYTNNLEYGIFPVHSSNGRIEFNEVSGSNDTGIYVGQSSDVAVEHNQASDCTVGIEVENSSRVNVRGNTAVLNSTGILVDLLPGLDVTATADITVTGNVLSRNNRPNPVADPADILSQLPSGIGLLNLGGDRVLIRNNAVMQNNTAGIIVIQLPPALASLDGRIEPMPDYNQIRDNVVLQNGGEPDPKLAPLPASDLIWDGSGTQNCWAGNIFKTAFPALPGCLN